MISGFDISQSKASARPLNGGGNNLAYQIELLGKPYFYKEYFSQNLQDRMRFERETAFLKYCEMNQIECVPKLITEDLNQPYILTEFIEGMAYNGKQVTWLEVQSAITFLKALNSPTALGKIDLLPMGAESQTDLLGHLQCVFQRLESLLQSSDLAKEPFIEIKRSLEEASHWLQSELNGFRNVSYDAQERVSPSDFGFHNAIQTKDGTPKFFDFEYAGKDDLLKTVCDFFCQVKIPVSKEWFDPFVEEVSILSGDRHNFIQLAHRMLPIYKLKWLIIVLNPFTEAGKKKVLYRYQIRENQQQQLELAQYQAVKKALSLLEGVQFGV